MREIRTFVSALALALLCCACPAAPASAGLIPVEDFYRVSALLRPVLSPDGRYVAAAVGSVAGRKQLAVIDLTNVHASKVVAAFSDADVNTYAWVNDDRLVFTVGDSESAIRWLPPGLWAVNRDGTESRQLIATENNFITTDSRVGVGKDKRLTYDWHLFKVLRDGSADVIVSTWVFDNQREFDRVKLARLDTRTSHVQSVGDDAPAHASGWLLSPEGAPVAVTTSYRREEESYLKDEQGWRPWEKALDYAGLDAYPYWAGPDGRLIVSARGGQDTTSLYDVDRSTLKLADKPLIQLPGYDFTGRVIYDSASRRLLGFRYEIDAEGTAWLDPGMRKVQADIDKLLPGTVNSIDCERCSSGSAVLVSASSDRQPPVYYVYQRDTQDLQLLGGSRPWIQPAQMGQRDMYRFAARDGLQIPVLVTEPAGKASAPRPAVVLVHGGPWARGAHWAWERDAQFLASRGYVVIEPEFRSSEGYGRKLERSGWKQWGLAMQDDVSDAVQWAVMKGLADPRRVCIAGASYGGYATLMGLIKTPELYKCGFEWVGVSDIDLMYSISWSDFSESWKQVGMPILVGDRVKDAKQLRETSPLEQAARLKRPVLMGYGGADTRVPMKHGEAMRDALVGAGNKDVEWVVYPGEGHGWHELKTNVDWWTRVEKFLDKNIGPGAAK